MSLKPRTAYGAVFAGVAAIGAALVPIGEATDTRWLTLVGLALALVSGIASLAIEIRAARRDANADLMRRTLLYKVQPGDVRAIDPTEIGVDSAEQVLLPGGHCPEYVAREIDGPLRIAVRNALTGVGPSMISVIGPSKVGKSRSLFEALLAAANGRSLWLYAPSSGDALLHLVTDPYGGSDSALCEVMWLDDLEVYVNGGTTYHQLLTWQRQQPNRLVVMTYGGKGAAQLTSAGLPGLHSLADEILQHTSQFALRQTTQAELDAAGLLTRGPKSVALARHGLAAYLVAAPLLDRKLVTGFHAVGETRNFEAAALVEAAADWQLTGRTDDLTRSDLEHIWRARLRRRGLNVDASFIESLEWAQRPVAGSISLLHESTTGIRPFDLVVRQHFERSHDVVEAGEIWEMALSTMSMEQLFAVAMSASVHGRLLDAVRGFRKIWISGTGDLPAIAGFNLGVQMSRLGRVSTSMRIYGMVERRYASAQSLPALEQVAAARVNRAALVATEYDDLSAGIAILQQVVRARGDLTSANGRTTAALALCNLATFLQRQGSSREGLSLFKQCITEYATDASERVQAIVAMCHANLGHWHLEQGAIDDATHELARAEALTRDLHVGEAFQVRAATAIYRFGQSEANQNYGQALIYAWDALTELSASGTASGEQEVVLGLLRIAMVLARTGQQDMAAAVYQQVFEDFGKSASAASRGMAAFAGLTVAAMHRAHDRLSSALTACEGVLRIRRIEKTVMGEEIRASAAFLLASSRNDLGDRVAAIGHYERLISEYSSIDAPGVRRNVADAFYNLARLNDLEGRKLRCIELHEQILARYSGSDDPYLRDVVILALYDLGVTLNEVGGQERALHYYDRLAGVARSHMATKEVATVVMGTLNRGFTLILLNREEDALDAFGEVPQLLGDESDPPQRRLLAASMLNVANGNAALGRNGEALETLNEMMQVFAEDADLEVLLYLSLAHDVRVAVLRELGEHNEAEAAHVKAEQFALSLGQGSTSVARKPEPGHPPLMLALIPRSVGDS